MLLGEFGTFSTKEVKGLWQILYPKASGCSPSSSKDLHFFPNSNQELKPSACPLGHPPPWVLGETSLVLSVLSTPQSSSC